MEEEIKKILMSKNCLGCGKACSLIAPNCHRGLEKMKEVIKEYNELKTKKTKTKKS